MKCATILLLVAPSLAPVSALSQAAGDPADRLRACSTLSNVEKMKCLDLLSREIGSEPTRPRPASSSEGMATQESWIISETTSPIDYSPVVIATTTASGAPNSSGMKLSIACRSGNTSLVLAGSGGLPAGDGYVVSYAIDGGSPKTLAAIAAPSGTGIALSGDIVGLLASLPARGEIAFRIVSRQDQALEGRYSLAGLRMTRERMAVSCRWPTRTDKTRK